MEDDLKKTHTKKEDDLKKHTKNGRQPKKKWKTTSKKMEDDLKDNFKKSSLIGCDIIEN